MENEQAAMGRRESVITRSRESPGAAVSHRRLDAWKAPRLGGALKNLFAPRGLSSAATRWLFRKGRCAASDTGCSQPMNARDEWLDFIVGQISGMALAGFQASDLARLRVWVLIAKEYETGMRPGEKKELADTLKHRAPAGVGEDERAVGGRTGLRTSVGRSAGRCLQARASVVNRRISVGRWTEGGTRGAVGCQEFTHDPFF